MSYELMSKRLNAIVPDETWDNLERVAEREMRTKSQMTAILLGEALAAYWKRNPPEPSEDAPAPKSATTKAPAKAPTAKAKPASAQAKRTKDSKGAS
ncbi:hypothetical protein QUB08_29285 [Microcoleus sp. BR0-C5]|uniref:ribbon-helix-helix domain-containing protein n=1 Tax=Microcoleus sp. BR0-C5 TaxID=2818713 RepID=UPI002FD69DC0